MPEPREMIGRLEERTGRGAEAWIEALRDAGLGDDAPHADRRAWLGDDIVPGPRWTYVSYGRPKQFAIVQPSTRVDVRRASHERLLTRREAPHQRLELRVDAEHLSHVAAGDQ